MDATYSDLPPGGPRPCRFCGADIGAGPPAHYGSREYFDEQPCERHQERGYKIPGCIDCTVEPWYACANCLGESTGGEPVPLDDIIGGADEPVH